MRFHPAVLCVLGLALSAYGQYRLSTMTLDSNASHVITGICLQGVGMAMMLVPINTVVLSNVPRHRLSDATGLSSLLRQIGGSMGLAVFATRLSGGGVIAREALKAHVLEQRPEVFTRLAGTQLGALARGMDPGTAKQLSIASLSGLVAKQGMVIAFDQMFILGSALFLAVMPLVFFLRRPTTVTAGPSPAAHHD
jgi:DHA2 family multidrug resistance protein